MRITAPFASAPLLLAALAVGCAPAPSVRTVDISAATDGARAQGLKVEGDRLHLLVEGRGILELDRDGALLTEHRIGPDGIEDRPYHDVGTTGRETYLLLEDAQGFLYDPATGRQTVHFCVVPGDIIGPMITQKNDAIDVEGEVIVAAPRFFEVGDDGAERLTSSELRTYRLADGVPLDTVVITGADAPQLMGVAVDGDGVIGVEHGRALRLGFDGAVQSTVALDGVDDAAGVAVDGDEVLVLDAADDQIVIFGADALR